MPSEEGDLLSLLPDPPGLGQGDVGGRMVEGLPGQELLDGADLQVRVVSIPAGRMVVAGAEAGAGVGADTVAEGRLSYAHYLLMRERPGAAPGALRCVYARGETARDL